ncbi:hypothetical protein VKT23_018974 [Stygiomarasmius scandens]|uniref:PUM-HD domain-containing protein n=1 Tax=Marasmiellus scandens TaxID=2682957 RepID=A0ABR1IS24_9AGAR
MLVRAQRLHPASAEPINEEACAILQKFHSSKAKGTWRLEHILGSCPEFSYDREGSILIRRALSSTYDKTSRTRLFREMVPMHVLRSMKHDYASHVIQSMLEVGTFWQVREIIKAMRGHALSLVLHPCASRVVEKAFPRMTSRQREEFVHEILSNDGLVTCAYSETGSHILEVMLKTFPQSELEFTTSLCGISVALSQHKHGYKVIKSALEYSPLNSVVSIVQDLSYSVISLSYLHDGHKVVLAIFQNVPELDKGSILDRFRGFLPLLSSHRFGSQVCKTIISVADPHRRRIFVDELIAFGRRTDLLTSSYANSVFCKIVPLVEDHQRYSILELVNGLDRIDASGGSKENFVLEYY